MRRRRIWIIVLTVVIAVAVAAPWYLLAKQANDNEKQAVVQSFVQKYGSDVLDLQIVRPDAVYVAYWTGSTARHVAWCLDGLWVEVYSVDILPSE